MRWPLSRYYLVNLIFIFYLLHFYVGAFRRNAKRAVTKVVPGSTGGEGTATNVAWEVEDKMQQNGTLFKQKSDMAPQG